jgi:hypothetical protein
MLQLVVLLFYTKGFNPVKYDGEIFSSAYNL